MALVSEDVPEAPGPNASMQFGEATENARLQHEIASRTGSGGRPQPGPAPAPAPPAQPPAPPVQSSPPDNPLNGQGRLDLNQVFPPLPQLNQSLNFRTVLRALAAHPALPGNSTIAQMADMIKDQKGPLG